MKKVLLFLWQIPQNLIGFIFFCMIDCQKVDNHFIFRSDYISSFSCGEWVFINHRVRNSENTLRHEYGHSEQSKILGWFYIPFVGIPSIIGNILHRFIRFNYYNQPWEKWADKLGDVRR